MDEDDQDDADASDYDLIMFQEAKIRNLWWLDLKWSLCYTVYMYMYCIGCVDTQHT